MAELTSQKKKADLYYVWTVISLFFMFFFGNLIPAWGPLTPMGVKMLGVFVGALVMTIFTNQTFWPAVLAIFAMVFHGYMSSGEALTGWFGSSTVQQFIWIMALCGALADSGAPVVIAKKMLSAKITRGHPYIFIFIYFCATAVVGGLLSTATATILLMFPILDGICEAAGISKDSQLKKHLLLGTYLSAMGAYVMPFKGVHLSSIAIISATLQGFGLEFDNGAYLVSTFLVLVLFLIGYVAFMRFGWKTDISPLSGFDITTMEGMDRDSLRLNKRQLILLGALGVGVAYIISLYFISADTAFGAVYNSLTATWVWIAIVAVLSLVKINGVHFINGAQVLHDKTMWGVVALIGCFSFCGGAISSDELGIKAWIGQLLTPLLGNASWPLLVIICVILATVFTNFMNGMPVSFVLNSVCVPFAAQLALTGSVNATVLGAAIVFSGQCAFMTYGAMVYAALLLSREEMTKKFIWTRGVMTACIYMVVASAVFIACGYLL